MIEECYFKACEDGLLDVIKETVKKDPSIVNKYSSNGWTGLIIAAFNQNIEVAKFLLANGAKINATNHKGTTVFMYAKTPVLFNPGNTEFLSFLIDNGADINAIDIFKKTVLDYVIKTGAFELEKWLRSKGARQAKELL